MGIYIIESKHANWIKVGHHKISPKRPNVYYRYIRRGFNKCIHPKELHGYTNFKNVHLLHWFPNLSIKQEREIHRRLKQEIGGIGEWYYKEHLQYIKDIILLDYNGIEEYPSEEDLACAKRWAKLE